MISLNEAYAHLLSRSAWRAEEDGGNGQESSSAQGRGTGAGADPGRAGGASAAGARPRAETPSSAEGRSKAGTRGAAAAGSKREARSTAGAGGAGEAGAAPAAPAAKETDPEDSVGPHREPAYAYYKQGFIHYSRAIHGIQALYRSFRRPHPVHFDPRDDAYERFAGSLTELRLAHEYFQRVAGEHAGSVWAPDARVKLARIARFSELYRRILRNLRRRSG